MQRNLNDVFKNWGCYPSLANTLCQFYMFQWWNLGGQIGRNNRRGCDQIYCPIFDVVSNHFSQSHISDGPKKSKISKTCSSAGKKKNLLKKVQKLIGFQNWSKNSQNNCQMQIYFDTAMKIWCWLFFKNKRNGPLLGWMKKRIQYYVSLLE